ncbi:MAG: diacylglycerol kinase [Nocardioidaceae bacterium]|nr:diacylglycerol kinase [Nocardioidaceae bacterium]
MAREIALLTNPHAGKGRAAAIAGPVAARLEQAGFRVRRLQGQDEVEARRLAADAVDDGVENLVVVGGDGLVHLAVQELAYRPTTLGIIPCGSGNDAARYFGVPRSDPLAAADVVVAGRVRTVDLARTGPAYFLCVLSAGFDALVNERANRMRWPRGQLRYHLATLAELRVFQPLPYTLELDGETKALEAMLVVVGNGASFGGGLRITEGAVLDDGLLDVVLFHPISKPDLVRTYPRLFSGTHTKHPAYEHHRVRAVTVAAPGVVAYADGERLGPLPVTVTAAPRALRVLVTPHA